MVRLGQEKNGSKHWVLTNCKAQRNRLLEQKKMASKQGTHTLLSAEGGTCQGIKRRPVSEGHLHPVKCNGRDKLGQGKKASKGHLQTVKQREGGGAS
jgi:hypothetical protein